MFVQSLQVIHDRMITQSQGVGHLLTAFSRQHLSQDFPFTWGQLVNELPCGRARRRQGDSIFGRPPLLRLVRICHRQAVKSRVKCQAAKSTSNRSKIMTPGGRRLVLVSALGRLFPGGKRRCDLRQDKSPISLILCTPCDLAALSFW